jgi:spermidine synthase
VGGPFFVLAATAPMLQRWFAGTDHPNAENPYFLYAASNAGSMAALLCYPFLIEPLLTLQQQTADWAFGYGLLAALIVLSALVGRQKPHAAAHLHETGGAAEKITARRIALWLALSFIPSSLMLGVTTYITNDLASIPLLWVIPLALYVGTFIIAFAREPAISLQTARKWHIVLLSAIAALFMYFAFAFRLFMLEAMLLHIALFFMTALLCHMTLAQTRPSARHLTAFYLVMSLGGVLGGIFNALVTPLVFLLPLYEYMLVLALSAWVHIYDTGTNVGDAIADLRARLGNPATKSKAIASLMEPGMALILILVSPMVLTPQLSAKQIAFCIGLFAVFILMRKRPFAFAAMISACMLFHLAWPQHGVERFLMAKRNFFGAMRVYDIAPSQNHILQIRILMHGTTNHGSQPLLPEYRLTPVSYYYKTSPTNDAFTAILDKRQGPQNVAVLGLGIGVVACYRKPERHFQFYEIDPDVVKIAEDKSMFTFLSDCGSPYDVTVGDARLKIRSAPDHSYDMIFIDTFSSDNIPIHIMTEEAFRAYFSKLKDDGIIVMNISNSFFNLEKVISAMARDLGVHAMFKITAGGKVPGTDIPYYAARFAVLAKDEATIAPLKNLPGWRQVDVPASQKAWTDNYSNLVGALYFKPQEVPKSKP